MLALPSHILTPTRAKVIVWQGGDINTSVYWADVTDAHGRIELDHTKAAQRPVNDYLVSGFARAVFDRNAHRLTLGKLGAECLSASAFPKLPSGVSPALCRPLALIRLR